MNTQHELMHYAKLYRGVVSDEICAKTVSEMNTLEFKEHTFYNANTGEYKPRSGSQELSMSWGNVSTKKTLNDIVDDTAFKYVQDLNMPWFDKYQGYTHVRFNKYAENKMMALHADHIHSMFDGERKGIPILSVLGVLNDDYEGGEFYLVDEKTDLSKGDIIVFPSNFMYPHKVEPVTKGTRYSYISWIW
jgi:hypothetical protein